MDIKQLINLTNSMGQDLIYDGIQYFINSDYKPLDWKDILD